MRMGEWSQIFWIAKVINNLPVCRMCIVLFWVFFGSRWERDLVFGSKLDIYRFGNKNVTEEILWRMPLLQWITWLATGPYRSWSVLKCSQQQLVKLPFLIGRPFPVSVPTDFNSSEINACSWLASGKSFDLSTAGHLPWQSCQGGQDWADETKTELLICPMGIFIIGRLLKHLTFFPRPTFNHYRSCWH